MAEKNNRAAWFTGLTNDSKIILGLVAGETNMSICFDPIKAKLIADHLYELADNVAQFVASEPAKPGESPTA